MTNQLILDFLHFPPNVDEFTNYESNIHIQIENQFNDTRALLLSSMKEIPVSLRKRFFLVKKLLDQLGSEFATIKSSMFVAEAAVEGKLSFNHEIVLILDFLIFERLLDFNSALRELESSLVYADKEEELLSVQAVQLHKSLQKLENLIKTRKVAHQLTPSNQLFQKFSTDFGGQISYLESIGVIHQFDNLSKPSLLGKRSYTKKLSQLFASACSSLQEKNKSTIPFIEFIDYFRKRYPQVEFDIADLEKIAKKLSKSGIIGIIDGTSDTPKQIILSEDTTLQQQIINLAKDKGYVTQEEIISSLGKSINEIQRTIQKLEDAGLAIEDDNYATGKRLYFPGLEAEKVQ
ncbi:MAG: hypothetical protein ACTSQE_14245 [Candidatus Heimdallarchaeaceae archaeon]